MSSGSPRLALAALLLAVPAVADRRGESICGEDPSEALAITVMDGLEWIAGGPAAWTSQSYAFEEEALVPATVTSFPRVAEANGLPAPEAGSGTLTWRDTSRRKWWYQHKTKIRANCMVEVQVRGDMRLDAFVYPLGDVLREGDIDVRSRMPRFPPADFGAICYQTIGRSYLASYSSNYPTKREAKQEASKQYGDTCSAGFIELENDCGAVAFGLREPGIGGLRVGEARADTRVAAEMRALEECRSTDGQDDCLIGISECTGRAALGSGPSMRAVAREFAFTDTANAVPPPAPPERDEENDSPAPDTSAGSVAGYYVSIATTLLEGYDSRIDPTFRHLNFGWGVGWSAESGQEARTAAKRACEDEHGQECTALRYSPRDGCISLVYGYWGDDEGGVFTAEHATAAEPLLDENGGVLAARNYADSTAWTACRDIAFNNSRRGANCLAGPYFCAADIDAEIERRKQ